MTRFRGWLSSAFVVMALGGNALAQDRSAEGAFTFIREIPAKVENGQPNVRPDRFRAVEVDWKALHAVLDAAPAEDSGLATTLAIPMPDGTWSRFKVTQLEVLPPDLRKKYPEIRSFTGRGIDDPAASVWMDYTPHGFHAMVLSPQGQVYVDPYTMGDTSVVTTYYRESYTREGMDWTCHTEDGVAHAEAEYSDRGGMSRRTFRIVISCTGEYTQYHGATVALGFAAANTAVTRITGIYDTEIAVRFQFATNADQCVFVNPATDPFLNSPADRDRNKAVVDARVGLANYDIAHVFGRGGGGIARIGSVCNDDFKAGGFSSWDPPIQDPFVVDYVSHEMGHQFGGRHGFNNCGGGAGDDPAIAYENGSGVTIMCYAGICGGGTDLAAHSIPVFGHQNLAQINAFLAGTTCAQTTTIANNPPVIDPIANRTIPIRTPFVLTANATDPNGDVVTYSWEQHDSSATAVSLVNDQGQGPIFRPYLPSLSGTRYFPRYAEVLQNTVPFGEILPTQTRVMNFRVTARDGRGATSSRDVAITLANSTGFSVTQPNTAVTWTGSQQVRWNVGGTNTGAINTPRVNILLSVDGGQTFPYTLASNVTNNGLAAVVIPSVSSTQARIKVEGNGNIFYDISNVDFTINPPPPQVAFGQGAGDIVLDDTVDNGNGNLVIEPGESAIGLTIPVVNTGTTGATNVTASLESLTPTVSIRRGGVAYPNIPAGQTRTNATSFLISVDGSHRCGEAIHLRMTVNSTQASSTFDIALSTGVEGPVNEPGVFIWTGTEGIPDNDPVGLVIPVEVAGLSGTLADIDFRFNGLVCEATEGSPTVGLSHTFVGDLIVTLQAPNGAAVEILNRPGSSVTSPYGSSGNNFCRTYFDDQAQGVTNIQNISPEGFGEPYVGTFTPYQPLALLNGVDPNGTWLVRIQDVYPLEFGIVRTFSLVITTQSSHLCTPPEDGCDPDFNQDGIADQDDVMYLVNVLAGGDNPTGRDPDFNRDGVADQDDYIVLINVIAGGVCP